MPKMCRGSSGMMIRSMSRVINGAELDESFAQDAARDERQPDADDEGQQQGGHDRHRGGHLDVEVGLQRAVGLLDAGQRRAGQQPGEQRGAHPVGEEAGEEGGGVGDRRGDAEPSAGSAPEIGDGGGDQPDDDQGDGEGQELAEQVGEGREDPPHGHGDQVPGRNLQGPPGAQGEQVDALGEGDAAQEQGEDDRDEDPHEDPALGDRSADGCGALGHGLPSGEGGVDRGGAASPLRGRMPQAARIVVDRPDRDRPAPGRAGPPRLPYRARGRLA